MSGIYIHIPFCRKRCHYCDFYTTTQLKRKPELVAAIIKELELRKDWLKQENIKTIYFGGGTPSLLSTDEIRLIIETVYQHFDVDPKSEITLEANPDDLTKKQVSLIAGTKVNRLSIGIQSFHNHQLTLMNRRHSAQDAIDSVKRVQDAGINNISVDLIYGLPESNLNLWQKSLEQVEKLKIQHLSAYHLTYEQGTVFEVKARQNKLFPCSEDESIIQFKELIRWAKQNNFIHYEISNFGLEGYFSQHNTSYWKQQKYLGVGPSAHSYNIESRAWNPSNMFNYIVGIENGIPEMEIEQLSDVDKFNEFLITSLRTIWGINLLELEHQFGSIKKVQLLEKIKSFVANNQIIIRDDSVILSDEGVFISDMVLAELMILPDE